jgi:hypothetical protein
MIMTNRSIAFTIIFGILLSLLIGHSKAYFEQAILGAMKSIPPSWVYPLLKYVAGPFGGALCAATICIVLGLFVEKRAFFLGMLSGAIGVLISEAFTFDLLIEHLEHIAIFLEAAAVVVGAALGASLGGWLKLRFLQRNSEAR